MTDATAACWGATSFDGGILLRRDQLRFARVVGGAFVGLGTVAIACLPVVAVATAVWMMAATHSVKSRLDLRAPPGPMLMAAAEPHLAPTESGRSSGMSMIAAKPVEAVQRTFASRWADAFAPAAEPRNSVPIVAFHAPIQVAPAPRQTAQPEPDTPVEAKSQVVRNSAGAETARIAEPPAPTPAPNLQKSMPVREAHNRSIAPPVRDSRTAVYDISARTVYMPNGEKLEAHSGLGERMDDPRFVHVKMRGPTPPNVYDLTLRERLFHGVRAIRLNPVDDRKMFGRDGMLAHTYMLGSNGQSNGCVSFKDYSKFLRAYLNGEVTRLVVVPRLGDLPLSVARSGGGVDSRYAAAEPSAPASALTW